MEKPGQRVTDSKIIERPELKTLLRKIIEGVVTALLWVIWGFFISRVFIILIPGLRAGFGISADASAQLFGVMRDAALIIIVIFLLDLLWIEYNYAYIFKKLRMDKIIRVKLGRPAKSDLKCFVRLLNADEKAVEAARKNSHITVELKNNRLTIPEPK
ncbi:MAG: hypothetical protein WC317_03660 [Candidatus Omnitrophota bacterium]|jgi:poly-beta-1,6-N-acetyl-D-glucosamine biosynthesis protein PgaD